MAETPDKQTRRRRLTVGVGKAERDLRAFNLRINGCTFSEIARELGFAHRRSAKRAVDRYAAEVETPDAEHARTLCVARLERLLAAVWPKALAGDPAAVTAARRIVSDEARLFCLFDRRIEVSGPDGGPIEYGGSQELLDAEIERLLSMNAEAEIDRRIASGQLLPGPEASPHQARSSEQAPSYVDPNERRVRSTGRDVTP